MMYIYILLEIYINLGICVFNSNYLMEKYIIIYRLTLKDVK